MIMSRIFEDNFVDNFIDDLFRVPAGSSKPENAMKTDILDQGDYFQLDVEVPGYKKENLKVELRDGYLTIKAEDMTPEDVKEEAFIRRERYTGASQRTFYVGRKIERDDIKASFVNGVLKLVIPKRAKKAEEDKAYIDIEG